MKKTHWLVWVIAALLALLAIDSFVFHPAGRWQMHATPGWLLRMDTTNGNVDLFNFETGKWEHLEGKK